MTTPTEFTNQEKVIEIKGISPKFVHQVCVINLEQEMPELVAPLPAFSVYFDVSYKGSGTYESTSEHYLVYWDNQTLTIPYNVSSENQDADEENITIEITQMDDSGTATLRSVMLCVDDGKKTTRINDLTIITSVPDSSVLVVDGDSGTRAITYSNFANSTLSKLNSKTFSLDAGEITIPSAINALYKHSPSNDAGGHNSVYRGKDLGTSFTNAMSSAITAGTFDDMYIGDYLTLNGHVYRIAGFNLIRRCGDTSFTANHVCFVPDATLYNAQMHNTETGAYVAGDEANTTEGGYVSSDMRTANLEQAKQTILDDFGSSHVLTYRDMLTTAVADGQASGRAWTDCQVELMSEIMVFGTKVWGDSGFETGIISSQFPLFALNPETIHIRSYYWLRSIRSSNAFCDVSNSGFPNYTNASVPCGVRPFFFVK